MSISASIDINLSKYEGKRIPAHEIIAVLVEAGWNLFPNGYLHYLTLGNNNVFDQIAEKDLYWEILLKMITVKELSHETFGIMLTWQNTDIGISFLFPPHKEGYNPFSIRIESNRQIIHLTNTYNITDFYWYLPKLLIPLNDAFYVEGFRCVQHI